MKGLPDRTYHAMSGLIAVLLAISTVVVGAKIAYGANDPVYHVHGTFSAAGQGMLSGSDVKIHGVNIGTVSSIRLVKGEAFLRLTIKKSETIPVAAKALIRPKTLFGEKFVDIDPGPTEATGPFIKDGGTIKNTLGGFELERILAQLHPVLKEINPAEFATILNTLARGGAGVAANVNHTIQNLTLFASGQADNAALTQRFIDDMAALSQTLADHADAAIAGARDAHVALPVINAHTDQFTALLKDASRLTGDVADVLENNRALLTKLVTEGGKVLSALDAQRGQLPGVVLGLRQFFQTLAEAGTGVPFGDTNLAKIKLVLGSECTHLIMDCSTDVAPGAEGLAAKSATVKGPSLLDGLRAPTTGVRGLQDLVAGLVG